MVIFYKKSFKNIPPADKSSFELEGKRKELTAAQARIQELEADITKLRKTNYILSERIKMFESMKDRELYDKYFPANSTTNPNVGATLPSVPTCNHHHHQCCVPPPTQCHGRYCGSPHTAPGTDFTVMMRELSEIVTQLSTHTQLFRSVLDKLTQSVQNPTHSQSQVSSYSVQSPAPPTTQVTSHYQTSAPTAPLSPDIVVLESSQSESPPPQTVHEEGDDHDNNQSMTSDNNTIDENVPEEAQNTNSLNFRDLTIQS